MPERQHAYRGEEIVTVLKGKVGGRRRVHIRNSRGFLESVRGKELQTIPANEPQSKLKYQGSE